MMPQSVGEARSYLDGAFLQFDEANKLWLQLKSENEIRLARLVLTRLRSTHVFLDGLLSEQKIKVNNTSICLSMALGHV